MWELLASSSSSCLSNEVDDGVGLASHYYYYYYYCFLDVIYAMFLRLSISKQINLKRAIKFSCPGQRIAQIGHDHTIFRWMDITGRIVASFFFFLRFDNMKWSA